MGTAPTAVRAAALLMALLAAPGCAAYRKCGLRGCPADQIIDARFDALLREHPALQAPNTVRAHTIDGVVYLDGQVNTDVERSEAESLARSIPNVRRVVDSIHFPYEGH